MIKKSKNAKEKADVMKAVISVMLGKKATAKKSKPMKKPMNNQMMPTAPMFPTAKKIKKM